VHYSASRGKNKEQEAPAVYRSNQYFVSGLHNITSTAQDLIMPRINMAHAGVPTSLGKTDR